LFNTFYYQSCNQNRESYDGNAQHNQAAKKDLAPRAKPFEIGVCVAEGFNTVCKQVAYFSHFFCVFICWFKICLYICSVERVIM